MLIPEFDETNSAFDESKPVSCIMKRSSRVDEMNSMAACATYDETMWRNDETNSSATKMKDQITTRRSGKSKRSSQYTETESRKNLEQNSFFNWVHSLHTELMTASHHYTNLFYSLIHVTIFPPMAKLLYTLI